MAGYLAESDKPQRCLAHTSINFAPLAGCFWAGEEKVRKINTGNSLHQTYTIASKARSFIGVWTKHLRGSSDSAIFGGGGNSRFVGKAHKPSAILGV